MPPKHPTYHLLLNSVFGAALIAFAIFTLSLSSLAVYKHFFQAKPLDEILTDQETIAFLKLDLSGANWNKLQNLNQKSAFSLSALVAEINSFFSIDFEKSVRPWLGSTIAVALINTASSPAEPIYLFHVTNISKARQFLENHKLIDREKIITEKFNGYQISEYQYSQKIAFTFFKRYLVISPSKDAVKNFLTSAASSLPHLKTNPNYATVKTNLPISHLGFLYLNLPRISESAPSFGPLKILKNKWLTPFLEIFPAFGAVLTPKEQGFVLSSYTVINKTILKDSALFSRASSYEADLINFADSSNLLTWGGHDLTSQLQRLLEISKEKSIFLSTVFEAALRNLKTQYLGSDISLEKDIYPLFQNEFLLTVSQNEQGKKAYQFIQKLKNPSESSAVITRVKKNFLEKNAFFEPYVATETSADGKEIPQIKNPSGLISEVNSKYGDIEISTLAIPGLDAEINLAIVDNLWILSSNLTSLKRLIDQQKSPSPNNLKAKLDFSLAQKIIVHSDEISFINVVKTAYNQEKIATFLPFDYILSGNNVFDDGISTIHYLRFLEKLPPPKPENKQ